MRQCSLPGRLDHPINFIEVLKNFDRLYNQLEFEVVPLFRTILTFVNVDYHPCRGDLRVNILILV